MSTTLQRITQWLRRAAGSAEDAVQGATPAATPPPGEGDDERETSTNAQTEGADGQPWSGSTY